MDVSSRSKIQSLIRKLEAVVAEGSNSAPNEKATAAKKIVELKAKLGESPKAQGHTFDTGTTVGFDQGIKQEVEDLFDFFFHSVKSGSVKINNHGNYTNNDERVYYGTGGVSSDPECDNCDPFAPRDKAKADTEEFKKFQDDLKARRKKEAEEFKEELKYGKTKTEKPTGTPEERSRLHSFEGLAVESVHLYSNFDGTYVIREMDDEFLAQEISNIKTGICNIEFASEYRKKSLEFMLKVLEHEKAFRDSKRKTKTWKIKI